MSGIRNCNLFLTFLLVASLINSVCKPCPMGTFLSWGFSEDSEDWAFNHDNEADCFPCAVGKFSNKAGSHNCDVCKGGTTDGLGATECGDCHVGWDCTGLEMIPCTAGRYSSGDGICKDCERGSYCPGSSDQKQCEAGTYSDDKAVKCQKCADGKFQPEPGQDYCSPCRQGHLCPPGAIVEQACDQPSTFCPISSETKTIVEPGHYSISESEESQGILYVGQKICEEGYACSGGIRTACAEGSYQTSTGQSICFECPLCKPGEVVFANCTGATVTRCRPCEAGQFSENLICKSCAKGSLSNAGSAYCRVARPGYYTTDGIEETQCPQNTFSLGNTESCSNCPENSYSQVGATTCTR